MSQSPTQFAGAAPGEGDDLNPAAATPTSSEPPREELGQLEDGELPTQGRATGAAVPRVAQQARDGPVRTTQAEELARLLKWAKEAKEAQQLRTLQLAKAAFDRGDEAPLSLLDFDKDSKLIAKGGGSRAALPRPEPPHVYTKHNRQDYNMWERDCESYHVRSPQEFTLEKQKVDFGVMYISETLKTLWKTHCQQKLYENPTWSPTWTQLKAKMLDSLGTLAERQQTAYEMIKRCKQRTNQSPTDLLNYLRPFWEELGEHNTGRQVLEYTASLLDVITKDLYLLPVTQRNTLVLVEEQANTIYRRHGLGNQSKEAKNEQPKDKKRQRDQDQSRGDGKPPKKPRKDRKGGAGPKKAATDAKSPNQTESGFSCYECGEPGHKRPDCPKLKDKAKKNDDNKPGKAKGQQSN